LLKKPASESVDMAPAKQPKFRLIFSITIRTISLL
jgi:hypothetical protein